MRSADDDESSERQTINIGPCAQLLGINRSTAYDLARRDQLPIPVIRLGRRMVVSRRVLDQLLDGHDHSPKTEGANNEEVVNAT